jgi:hypothetical protein
MAARPAKQLPEERRRAEASLSEFAEYVEKQQALRYGASNTVGDTTTTTAATTAATNADASTAPEQQHHAELDELLDGLDLTGAEPQVMLKGLLLGDSGSASSKDGGVEKNDPALDKLQDIVTQRIDEDGGETVFDLGFENNGDSMGLTRAEFDIAFARFELVARRIEAECQLLLTRNVGGPVEATEGVEGVGAGGANSGKDCSGKVTRISRLSRLSRH